MPRDLRRATSSTARASSVDCTAAFARRPACDQFRRLGSAGDAASTDTGRRPLQRMRRASQSRPARSRACAPSAIRPDGRTAATLHAPGCGRRRSCARDGRGRSRHHSPLVRRAFESLTAACAISASQCLYCCRGVWPDRDQIQVNARAAGCALHRQSAAVVNGDVIASRSNGAMPLRPHRGLNWAATIRPSLGRGTAFTMVSNRVNDDEKVLTSVVSFALPRR